MLISLQLARQTLAGITQACPVPIAPEVLDAKSFLHHGHVMVGDQALRGYKNKGRWWLDDRNVRNAGTTLGALPFDAHDLADIELPLSRETNRRPLCASCNTFEGKGISFLDRPGAVQHLLQCTSCDSGRTLPARFQADVARAAVEREERHGKCRSRPYAVLDPAADAESLVFRLRCRSHGTAWTKQMTAAAVADLVAAFVANWRAHAKDAAP
ncbi:hypothetical protein [Streptomyces decoyicus]|uniref:hypothetical protein n=1 Tax=Streptomyces decoyicus TaxID=249567 RepID=UPI0036496959